MGAIFLEIEKEFHPRRGGRSIKSPVWAGRLRTTKRREG
jgi:hypothetical protein